MGTWGLAELSIMRERWVKILKKAKTKKTKEDANYWIARIDKEIKEGFKRRK